MSSEPQYITVEARIEAPVAKVWEVWTSPEHIIQWNAASPDWHTPRATNDLRVGGLFTSRMEAKDGSMGFDFAGTYTEVEPHALLAYRMGEGEGAREVRVEFEADGEATIVKETFAAETTHPVEFQRQGWQSILNNFKAHTEAQA